MRLELEDGYVCEGFSYGAKRSTAGELVFQTGMAGYPESLTDPSYRGQILVCTFPLSGNYGVPSRTTRDTLLHDLPAYFESSEIHIAGLVTASYSGENYSHFLAESSLGAWLKEHNIPAIHGVDTRALTKRIREKGSLLGKLLIQKGGEEELTEKVNGNFTLTPFTKLGDHALSSSEVEFESLAWTDQNKNNLVADGILLRMTEQLRGVYSNAAMQSPFRNPVCTFRCQLRH